MGTPFIGELRLFAGNFAPVNWAFCDGRLLPISENTALFTLIGTTYGGDGTETFALPNLASRIPFHAGTAHGQTLVLGQQAGEETVTLTTNTMPAHTHVASGLASSATTTDLRNNLWASWADDPYLSGSLPNEAMDPAAVGVAGGSQPHDNMPPVLVISYIICLAGIFPSPD
jgi:microcystin-dependent protein